MSTLTGHLSWSGSINDSKASPFCREVDTKMKFMHRKAFPWETICNNLLGFSLKGTRPQISINGRACSSPLLLSHTHTEKLSSEQTNNQTHMHTCANHISLHQVRCVPKTTNFTPKHFHPSYTFPVRFCLIFSEGFIVYVHTAVCNTN